MWRTYTVFHLSCGRSFMCFVLDPASVHGPKTKRTKLLPQADVWKLIIQRQEYGLESVSWHERSESDNAANSTG